MGCPAGVGLRIGFYRLSSFGVSKPSRSEAASRIFQAGVGQQNAARGEQWRDLHEATSSCRSRVQDTRVYVL